MEPGKGIILLILASCLGSSIRQDVKVAAYFTGKADTDTYEKLSFWIKTDQRAYIRYLHGKDADDIELAWSGRDSLPGKEKGFKVRFPDPDTTSWYIFPDKAGLTVMDRGGKYRRSYTWENEQKAGDSTTFCPICVQNEKEAMKLLQKYFFH